MDGRRGAPGFRVTREWADPSSSRTTRSNWTTGPVHTDRTDTPNLGWEHVLIASKAALFPAILAAGLLHFALNRFQQDLMRQQVTS